ncbi:MAG: hypothetical protein GF381_01090 [Candidatus Pacebacteria bacterium]|nr:hypothetical protein [Candidatus Paceibacterota bacterium]
MKKGETMPTPAEDSLRNKYYRALGKIRPGQNILYHLDSQVKDVSAPRMRLVIRQFNKSN